MQRKTHMHHGIYIGPREDLKGKGALLVHLRSFRRHTTAQFDDLRLPESRGWHTFLKKHFSRLRPTGSPPARSQAHRRKLNKQWTRRSPEGCGKKLAAGQFWSYCGETDMGQTAPALCEECWSLGLCQKEPFTLARIHLT
jgi:hypothetical protein